MLSNNLKKASSILSTRCFHRCLASAAAPPTSPTSEKDDINKTQEPSPPKPGAPRGIPTRHSRHNEPLVAPVETLDESCQRIIASTPGTLFCKYQCVCVCMVLDSCIILYIIYIYIYIHYSIQCNACSSFPSVCHLISFHYIILHTQYSILNQYAAHVFMNSSIHY